VAPVLANTTLPEGEPAEAEAEIRMYRVPPALGRVAEVPQVESSAETSKFVGAVTVMLSVKADPVTATEAEVEAVPEKLLSSPRLPTLIEGVEPLGVPLTDTLSVPAPAEFTALILTE